jgi:hypothetical protein
MQTPKEFLHAVSLAFGGIERPPIVKDIAELEQAAKLAPIGVKIELLFKDFLPQILALTFIAFVLGSSLGVSIGRHVQP